ncbi:hypothetical protein [Aureliella helgolandensis]|uniref:Uncharacterized protein n=1 Tax=Aureliella helgolandensis TaxID=2527968 RepID=A0A518GDM4_9BACT|nr:hypothetical protein [Aureliella helgolandensis]QDV26648.1 hypothetical protein Q31a_50240 [Aureliella helgolandensis]
MTKFKAPMKFTAVALLFTTAGCSTFSKSGTETKGKDWLPTSWFKKEYQHPTSLAVIWSPDTLAVAGRPTTRGFGGRIYFYNDRSQAIPVEGDLVVHGYVTTPGHGANESVKADKSFAFTAEQLSGHFSPSEIGASYSIWIPWDEADGYREGITLIPTFKSTEGSILQGEAAKLFLPGKSRDPNDIDAPRMQAVSYQTQSVPTNSGDAKPTMRTTVIDVPRNASLVRKNGLSSSNGTVQTANSNRATNRAISGSAVQVGGGQSRPVSTGVSAQNYHDAGNFPKNPTIEFQLGTTPKENFDLRVLTPPPSTSPPNINAGSPFTAGVPNNPVQAASFQRAD